MLLRGKGGGKRSSKRIKRIYVFRYFYTYFS